MAEYWINTGNSKVHGPFSGTQLKQLAAKGELNPQHRISTDRKKCVLATSVKGLELPSAEAVSADPLTDPLQPLAPDAAAPDPFADFPEFGDLSTNSTDVLPTDSYTSPPVATTQKVSLAISKQWCCLIGGQQIGPIDTARVRDLAKAQGAR